MALLLPHFLGMDWVLCRIQSLQVLVHSGPCVYWCVHNHHSFVRGLAIMFQYNIFLSVFIVVFCIILWFAIGFAMWLVAYYIVHRFPVLYKCIIMKGVLDQGAMVVLWPILLVIFPLVTIYLLFDYFLIEWKVDGFNTITQKVSFAATGRRLQPKKPKYDFMRDSNRKLKRGFSKNE